MPRWIRVPERIVQGVAVTIEALRVGRVWYNGIGREEAVNIRHIKTRIHVNQPQVIARQIVLRMTRIPPVGKFGRRCSTEGTEGHVGGASAADFVAPAVGEEAGAALASLFNRLDGGFQFVLNGGWGGRGGEA